MADQIGFYGKLPEPPSAESMEADRKERIEREARKDREARERAIQAGIDAYYLINDREESIARAAAEAAIKSILESMSDYDWF